MGQERYRKTAYVTFAIIVANILCFLYLETQGSTEDARFMIDHGAMFEPAILYANEYWRLLTSVFMHFGVEHLANNMLILFVLGDNLERALGKVKYAVFYLVCGPKSFADRKPEKRNLSLSGFLLLCYCSCHVWRGK